VLFEANVRFSTKTKKRETTVRQTGDGPATVVQGDLVVAQTKLFLLVTCGESARKASSTKPSGGGSRQTKRKGL
jgi:hypothetical protein